MTKENRNIDTIKYFVGFIAIVIAVFILKVLASIFIPLLTALFLYFIFNGVIKKLVSWKIPRFIALIFLLIFIFSFFYLVGLLIHSSASALIVEFPDYYRKLIALLTDLSEKLELPITDVEKYIKTFDWTASFDKIVGVLTRAFGTFMGFVGNLLLVLVYLVFMLAGGDSLLNRIDKAFTGEQAEKIKRIILDIEIETRKYFAIKTFIGLLQGINAAVILLIVGSDLVLVTALLVTLLNYVPNIGSVIAVIVPVIIGLLQYGLSLRFFLLLGGLIIGRNIINKLLLIRLAGKRLNISPIVILLSLIFWGYILGVMGFILSIPLIITLKIVCKNIPTLKPIADLMGNDNFN